MPEEGSGASSITGAARHETSLLTEMCRTADPPRRPGGDRVLELLEFADLWWADARGPGMDAYPDRDAWLATRHDWETRHGMTVAKWSEPALAELQSRARSLVELNEVLELTMYEPDDWQDPRDRPGAADGRWCCGAVQRGPGLRVNTIK